MMLRHGLTALYSLTQAAWACRRNDHLDAAPSVHHRHRPSHSHRAGHDEIFRPFARPDYCLGTTSDTPHRGSRISADPCDQRTALRWHTSADTLSTDNRLCLDVKDGRARVGTPLQLWDCASNNTNQKFDTHAPLLRWEQHDLCVSLAGGLRAPSNTVVLARCDGTDSRQRWLKQPAVSPQKPSMSATSASTTASEKKSSSTMQSSTLTRPTSTTAVPTTTASSAAAACSDTPGWTAAQAQAEAETLVRINQARARGANCGSEGYFPPVEPLVNNRDLLCLARSFAKDMADNNYFSHTDRQGRSPFQRMEARNITYSRAAENIAKGYGSPEAVVAGWLASDGHCANLMGPYTRSGIGMDRQVWVQDFTAP